MNNENKDTDKSKNCPFEKKWKKKIGKEKCLRIVQTNGKQNFIYHLWDCSVP